MNRRTLCCVLAVEAVLLLGVWNAMSFAGQAKSTNDGVSRSMNGEVRYAATLPFDSLSGHTYPALPKVAPRSATSYTATERSPSTRT